MKASTASTFVALVFVATFTVPFSSASSCTSQKPPSSSASVCSSQKLMKAFANCLDLPHLGAFLHYTYNSTNSSISIAFIAKPSKPEGWVAWGINPVRSGMDGTQAFVAYKETGIATVKTYDVQSPASVLQKSLSFANWGLSTTFNSVLGEFTIYASAKLPSGSKGAIEQVWQVGPSVTNGALAAHALTEDNDSHGPLTLLSSP